VKAAASGAIRPRVPVLQAAALLGEPELLAEIEAMAAKEKKGKAADCAKSMQELLQTPSADEKGACDKLAETIAATAAPLKTAAACAKDGERCWTKALSASDPLVRARASYELGRLGAASAVPALIKACGDQDYNARLAAIRSTEWLLPVAAAKGALQAGAKALAAQLEAEQGRVQFVKVNEELKRLQWKLAHVQ
jgi:hypothetical protein